MVKITAGLCALFLFIASCRHTLPIENGSAAGNPSNSGTGNCDANTVYFQQQVLPILVSNCTMSGCHDPLSRRDGVVLTTYRDVMNTAEVRPGNPGESKLYELITHSDARKRMPPPPAAALSNAEKALIFQWIQQGAKDLVCQTACDTAGTISFSRQVQPLLSTKCTGCHGSAAPQAGINLAAFDGVKAKVADGKLLGSVQHQPGFSPMPKNGSKLSDCELTMLRKWINNGALNN